MAPIGIEAAACEMGVAIDRLVAVDANGCRADEWADRVAAVADGFELILAYLLPSGPPAAAERVIRKVRQRVRARGVVLLTVSCVSAQTWCSKQRRGSGKGSAVATDTYIADGSSCESSGRRVPRPIEREMWLPGITGRPELIEPAAESMSTMSTTVTAEGVELERAG